MLDKLVPRGAAVLFVYRDVMLTPCPYCGRQPTIDICEPWPKSDGPQPWYVGCYRGGAREHFIGINGDTKEDAIAAWEREVAKHDR